MERTVKPATFIWIALSFVLVMVSTISLGIHRPGAVMWAISLLIVAYPAYRTYRNGAPAGTVPDTTAKRMVRWASTAAIVVFLGAVGLNVLTGGNVNLNGAANWGGASIEGKYMAEDGVGSRAEFMSDGTLVFTSGGQQGVWKWSKLDDGRIKLEPGPGMLGVQTAVCGYSATKIMLHLTNCSLAMTLDRM